MSTDLGDIKDFVMDTNAINNDLFLNHNFVVDVTKIIEEQKFTNTDNAINLNRKMQEMLRKLQQFIQEMLKKCKAKFKQNEEYLSKSKSIKESPPKKIKRFKSFGLCGIPFFKDDLNYPAPPNCDYLYRRDIENELFPIDLLNKTMCWTLNDKINIIKGVKEQVISYLKDGNNAEALSLRNTRNLKGRISEKNDEYNSLLLVNLLKMSNNNFVINWYRISSDNIKHRHNELLCEAMWNMYLRPEINRSKWSAEDTAKLEILVRQYNFSNWSNIANAIGNRSEYQCYIHYITVIYEKKRIDNQKWTKSDDNQLLEAVEKSRMGNIIRWNIVQQYFPHRNKKQLNTRYNYSLDPKIRKGNFTKEEDCIILAAVQEYGENFSTMPSILFPGRSIIQVRSRYNNTLKFISKHKEWTPEDDQQLLNFVEKNGKLNWRKLSDEFGYHTRTSCRQRYATIMKYFNKNPNSNVYDLPRKSKKVQSDITIDNWKTKLLNLNVETTKKISKNYKSRLRSLELKYYNCFKYSYDYKFNKQSFILYNPIMNLNYLTNLFQLNINENLLNRNEQSFSINDYKILQMLIKIRENNINIKIFDNIKIQPNWSTLLGFRSICIQCASTTDIKTKSEDNEIVLRLKETEKFKIAKEKFKKRFYSLFENTILLTRLNPINLDIREQFADNMDLGIKEMKEIDSKCVYSDNKKCFDTLNINLIKRKYEESENNKMYKKRKINDIH